ncbi:hypothetical protein [Mesorhizobium sophorae]|uniref:hypothetical protein n=1 Tax=Mesorhizobium sophorae TaxID=1300294 RepID=UPI000BA3A750|nr:hypothetical protein [Mesorhizobium sophorae]
MMTAAEKFIPSREMVDCVSDWRQRHADVRFHKPIVPLLVERFGLKPLEAIAVIRASKSGGANASAS